MIDDPKALRRAFGRFMTGVTVVTTRAPDNTLCGFTANSFSSVSLPPPLLLVCPGKFLSTFDSFATCTRFAVSLLAEGQEEVSNTFASHKGDRFAKVPHSLDAHGVPLIDGAIAQFSCTTWQSIPAGDHQILIGEVQSFAETDYLGLGYAGGQYFSLGLERDALGQTTEAAICGAIITSGDSVLLERSDRGLHPPQILLKSRGTLRQDLKTALAARGLPIHLGPAYSVYDDASHKNHHAYFLADTATDAVPQGMAVVAIKDLETVSYTTPAVAEMMTRYARETRTRCFGLYLGDARHGDIHSMTGRS